MIEVSAEQMYAEACRQLGEALVRERILSETLDRLAAENAALRQQASRVADRAPASGNVGEHDGASTDPGPVADGDRP